MINAADFIYSKDLLSLVQNSFVIKKKSIISLVRIACHFK